MTTSLLCIFAHPDDEATVGPLLALRAQQGIRVQVLSVTPGQRGLTPNHSYAAGHELAAVRTEELRQACQCLGIEAPVIFDFEDGALSHRNTAAQLVDQIAGFIRETKPTDVITFGPEGASGHIDHRILNSAVTEVFQQHACPARRLWYVAYPHSLLHGLQTHNEHEARLKTALLSRLVADEFLESTDCAEGQDAAERAIRCHKTQWSPGLMQAWIRLNREWLRGNVYLRKAMQRD